MGIRNKKKIGKFKVPGESKIPKGTKNNDLGNDSKATDEVIAELRKIKDEILEKTKDKKDLTPKEKLKIAQDLAITRTKENKILQNTLKKARQESMKNKGTKRVSKHQSTTDKAKQQIKKIEIAYIEFYKDGDSKVYQWIPLYKVPPILINHRRRTLYLMEEPAKFLNGKEVYILIENIPFTIPMNFFMNDLYENLENLPNLERDKEGEAIFGRAHLSPKDLYAKYLSIKFQMLFGLKRTLARKVLEYALAFGLGLMTMYIILSPYLFASG